MKMKFNHLYILPNGYRNGFACIVVQDGQTFKYKWIFKDFQQQNWSFATYNIFKPSFMDNFEDSTHTQPIKI
jgi:hypothetical protein